VAHVRTTLNTSKQDFIVGKDLKHTTAMEAEFIDYMNNDHTEQDKITQDNTEIFITSKDVVIFLL